MNVKQSAIERNARQIFFYVPLPEGLRNRMNSLAKSYDGAEEVDHCTLLFIPKAAEDVPQAVVDSVLKAAEDVGKKHAPINAKIQGWAYFDGATKDGKEVTALVGLLDAPGLEDLHVALKTAVKGAGVTPASNHGFTPHITFAYLKKGERVDDLPLLDGSFTIDKFCLSNREIHDVKLEGTLGTEAAKAAGLRESVMQALGEASMCWDHPPRGVFDSDRATSVGERLLQDLGKEAASHAEERAVERTKMDPRYVSQLEAFLHDKKLPPIPLHIAIPGGGHVALSPAGKRHVVSTVLGPGMKPKGVPLSSVLKAGRIPSPTLKAAFFTGYSAAWSHYALES